MDDGSEGKFSAFRNLQLLRDELLDEVLYGNCKTLSICNLILESKESRFYYGYYKTYHAYLTARGLSYSKSHEMREQYKLRDQCFKP